MNSIGKFERKPYFKNRKIIGDMVELSSKMHQMNGNMEMDVTTARVLIRNSKTQGGESQSFTAWFVKCVAQAVNENKDIQALRKGNDIIVFDDVDVLVMIDSKVGRNQAAIPYVVRNANRKNCREIHKEIRAAQKLDASNASMMLGQKSWLMNVYPHMPKPIRMLLGKIIIENPFYIKQNTGTISVTSIGMMGKVNGWISPISPLPLSFAICSILKKPYNVNDKIEIREILNIAFTADHDLIDGAPLIRFLSRLSELVESGYSLDI